VSCGLGPATEVQKPLPGRVRTVCRRRGITV
jgi:hypothetical protein